MLELLIISKITSLTLLMPSLHWSQRLQKITRSYEKHKDSLIGENYN